LIKLKRNFDKSQIESHVSNSKCIKNKGLQDLRKFFCPQDPQDKPLHKWYLCSFLYEEKHFKYIKRAGGFTIFGKALPVKKVAQELFLCKFTEKTNFSYSKLNSNQSKRLNNKLSARSK
ncbi:32_t:CDS:1, partial [Racocetra fulgida]